MAEEDDQTIPASEEVVVEDEGTALLGLQDAEIALTEFRHQVRSDLRSEVTHGGLSSESVALLKSQLDAVRASLRDSFRS